MATLKDPINILSVPADTGSIICGEHRAPRALLDAGLVSTLQAAGYHNITGINALPAGPAVWEPSSPEPNWVRNEVKNIEVYHQTNDVVGRTLSKPAPNGSEREKGALPSTFILGARLRHPPRHPLRLPPRTRPRQPLLYIDADTDLARPEPGIPDALGALASTMTMTHKLHHRVRGGAWRPSPCGGGSESVVEIGLNTGVRGERERAPVLPPRRRWRGHTIPRRGR